jgi:hypothetical protein
MQGQTERYFGINVNHVMKNHEYEKIREKESYNNKVDTQSRYMKNVI